MSQLNDDVLPLIRTRAHLDYWRASEHGTQMHRGVDLIESMRVSTDPAEVFEVVHKALGSAIRVIARADDSNGIIGDACVRLLDLHPGAAYDAKIPARRLLDWMVKFQFDDEVDFFTIDPVRYAPALGAKGMAAYRKRLDEVRKRIGPLSADEDGRSDTHSHERWTLEHNDRRLAVYDRDVDAIVRTHGRDQNVAAWLADTARALLEIDETEMAVDWAQRATYLNLGHQSLRASELWCKLLEVHRPHQLFDARLEIFRRWPTSSTAAQLHETAGVRWEEVRNEVIDQLAADPRQAVTFALVTLKDAEFGWSLAHQLALDDASTWVELVKKYEKIDAMATLPVQRQLAVDTLTVTDAQNYRMAARRLARMRKIAAGTGEAPGVDNLIADLREEYRRRPRLQSEFDKAGLPTSGRKR